jgi:hypothetical protein
MSINPYLCKKPLLMRAVFLFLPVLLSCILGCGPRGPSFISIAEKGQTKYLIAYEGDTAREPALELRRYLQQITGIEFALLPASERGEGPAFVLRVKEENASRDPLTPGRLRLRTDAEDVLFEGSDPEYLWFAVYEFLERFAGCRWLAPGEDFAPQLETIEIPSRLNYSYEPDIATRTVHSRLFYDNPDFARKLRVTTEAFPYYAPEARVHTFHRFMPEADFFQAHPEYYALRDGRRVPTQLCLTNPEVLRIVIDSVGAHFARNPEAKVVSVSTDDNTLYCTCPDCSRIDEEEGSPAGTLLRFVNEVAEQFPEKTISTLAYQYTRAPGKTKPRENVLITLCPIECDRSGPIAEKCEDFADDLNAWRKKGATLRIWDYTTQFTNFLAPFPNLHTLQPNVQLFRKSGARWVFEQHSGQPSELFELRSYLTAKLLWNPELEPDTLIKDFCEHYYGPAAPFILNYIQTIHDELAEVPDFFLFLYGDPSQAFDSYLRADLLYQYRLWMDEAEAVTSADSTLHARVKRARLGVDYAVLEACRKNLAPKLSLREPWLPAFLKSFAATCRDNNITLINETGYTVREYANAYTATMTRAKRPNLAAGKPVTLLSKATKYAGEDPQTLTDGAFGGAAFYANWLGFVGEDLIAEVDLGEEQTVRFTGMAFLQVTNHIVFFPTQVEYSYAGEDRRFKPLGTVATPRPLTRQSKVNDTHYFDLSFTPVRARYLKAHARSLKTAPDWHHGAGLPCWVFADEWLVR